MTPLEFHEVCMMLSARFSFRETSGYRSVTANNLPDIQGNSESRHLVWLARDIVLDNPADTEAFIKEARRQGLVVVDEGDHLHVQTP